MDAINRINLSTFLAGHALRKRGWKSRKRRVRAAWGRRGERAGRDRHRVRNASPSTSCARGQRLRWQCGVISSEAVRLHLPNKQF